MSVYDCLFAASDNGNTLEALVDCQPLVAAPAATSLTRASTVLPLSLAANRQSNKDTLGYPVCGISETPLALPQLWKGVADPWLR